MKAGLVQSMMAVVCLYGSAWAEDEASENDASPPFTVTEGEIRFPGVTVDRESRQVKIDAEVCLEEGILEYVVCKPNTFEHEAIFTTEASPELVHAALLLAGLKPTPQRKGLDEIWFRNALKQDHSRVKIEVEWKDQGKLQRKSLTDLLRSRVDVESLPAGGGDVDAEAREAWVFAGSFMDRKRENNEPFYAANLSGILVGIWPEMSAVIQYGIPSGNPYEGEHQGFEIDKDEVPALGTKVSLIFSLLDQTKNPQGAADPGDGGEPSTGK